MEEMNKSRNGADLLYLVGAVIFVVLIFVTLLWALQYLWMDKIFGFNLTFLEILGITFTIVIIRMIWVLK
jgi:hypothetical protein